MKHENDDSNHVGAIVQRWYTYMYKILYQQHTNKMLSN